MTLEKKLPLIIRVPYSGAGDFLRGTGRDWVEDRKTARPGTDNKVRKPGGSLGDPFVLHSPFLSMRRMCLLEGQRVGVYSWGSKAEEMATTLQKLCSSID